MANRQQYDGARVRAGRLFDGYDQALNRLLGALTLTNPDSTFFGLFETLNWSVALDDVIGETWRPDGNREGLEWRTRVTGGELMDGIRYARNRVHHQWADALWHEHHDGGVLPFGGHSWLWRPLDELPSPSKGRASTRGQDAYRDMLARDSRVAYTLTDLREVFSRVMAALEPPRAALGRGD